MKRFLTLFLSFVLCFCLCACNDNHSNKVQVNKNDNSSNPSSSSNDSTASNEVPDDSILSPEVQNNNLSNNADDNSSFNETQNNISLNNNFLNESQENVSSNDNILSNESQENVSSNDNILSNESNNDSMPDNTTSDITPPTESSDSNNDLKQDADKREPYSNAQGYLDISKVVTKNGRTYVEKEGKPFNLHTVHIRIDLICENLGLLNKKQFDVYLREYFRQAALLGFNSVNCQVHWDRIEIAEDVFDFTLYECVRNYCEEFNLNIQWLWTGSDNCGYYFGVPTYIETDLKNYPRMDNTDSSGKVTKNAILDYSNPKLVEREKNALNKFMTWLYQYDTTHRTVVVQILNEANAVGYGGTSAPAADATEEEVDRTTWVNGQRDAILHLMNELGMVVKKGPYRCVTRYNFISYHCYNNDTSGDEVQMVLDLDGIDLVGMDCFDTGMSMDNVFMTRVAAGEGNIPHIPETLGGVSTVFGKMLNAFKLGGNLFPYQILSTDGYDNLSIFRLNNYEFIERDGTASVGSVLEAKTADWRSFNYMVDAVDYMLTVSDLNDFVTFNMENQSLNISETKTVAGLKVGFNATAEGESYGSVGFCMKAADGSYLFYSQKGTTTFTLENATLSGNISKGYYDADGKWVETGVISKTGNGFVITTLQASKGSVFRIESDQIILK